ncbi:MAG: hypothetical protein PWP31_312 [Clostridia bacterium]|nr:hypothetical protein [Clostridia bacterium]
MPGKRQFILKLFIVPFLLIFLLACPQSAMAQPNYPLTSAESNEDTAPEIVNGQTFKGFPNIKQKLEAVQFTDTLNHWSYNSVLNLAAQDIVHGRGEGRFVPEANVTREEALALLARLTALEENLQNNTQIPPLGQPNRTIAIAAAGGLLSPEEFAYTKEEWKKPAERQEVVTWVGRALELTPVSGGVYPYLASFNDGLLVDEEKAPWIEAVLQEDLVAGVNPGVFAPRRSVKRGEIAALLSRIDKKLGYRRGVQQVEGQVTERLETHLTYGELLVTLRVATLKGPVINLEVKMTPSGEPINDFILYKDGKLVLGQKLTVGDPVQLTLQGGHVLLAQSRGDRQSQTGMILAVDDKEILLQDYQGNKYRYDVGPMLAKKPYSVLARIIPGQEVTVKLQGGVVSDITPMERQSTPAYIPDDNRVLDGYLREIRSNKLYVVTPSGKEEEVKVNHLTQIARGGQNLDVMDLKVGDKVKVTLNSYAEAKEIKVGNSYSRIDNILKGKLDRFNYQDGRVVLRGAKEFFYGEWLPAEPLKTLNLNRKATTEIGDQYQTGYSQREPEVIVAAVKDSRGETGIEAAKINKETRIYEGFLEDISLGAGEILLEGESNVFTFNPQSLFVKNNQVVNPADLEQGDYLFIEVTPAEDSHQIQMAVTEDLLPRSWQLYRGEIETVGKEEFELDDVEEMGSTKGEQYDWEEADDDDMEFDLAWESVIIGEDGPLTRDQFAYSRFTEDFEGYEAYVLARDEEAKGILVLPESATDANMLSVGRIQEIDLTSGEITVNPLRDWSPGYRNWQSSSFPMTLDVNAALVMKEREVASFSDLKVNDNVYIVHDRKKGLVLVAND